MQESRQILMEEALQILADPGKHARELVEGAAARVNAGFDIEKSQLASLEARFASESLDLLGRGDDKGASALAKSVLDKRSRVTHLEAAIKEANRRLLQARREAEEREAREKIASVRELMKEREDEASKLALALKDAGQAWARVVALGDRIWGALPHHPSDAGRVNFLVPNEIERGIELALYAAAGRHIEGGDLDLLAGCRHGHRQMIEEAMPKHLRQTIQISAEEFERRKSAASA
jgi:hypothetical protein